MCVKDYGGWTLQLLVCREASGGSVLKHKQLLQNKLL